MNCLCADKMRMALVAIAAGDVANVREFALAVLKDVREDTGPATPETLVIDNMDFRSVGDRGI